MGELLWRANKQRNSCACSRSLSGSVLPLTTFAQPLRENFHGTDTKKKERRSEAVDPRRKQYFPQEALQFT
jgi:hypothetical protein